MKWSLPLILAIFLICFSCAEKSNKTATSTASEPILSTINVLDFNKLLTKKGGIILDVRTKEEFDEAHLVQAINIDFYGDQFEKQIDNLDKRVSYFVYCRSGNRSGQTLEMMKEKGFMEVYDLDGGIEAWTAVGLIVE